MIADLINKDRTAFTELLVRNHVHKLYAFGSSVHGPFTDQSDVDVLVDVRIADDLQCGRALVNVWNGLESIFNRPVDLLTDDSMRNPYLRAEVERTKLLIYDGSKHQVLV